MEEIGFQPADVGKLAEEVLGRSGAINETAAREDSENAFVRGRAAGWITGLIEKDPIASAPYVPKVENLLVSADEDVRFWSACALLQSEGRENPTITNEISAGLENGGQARVAWASQLLQNFGAAARPVVPALLQAAGASFGNARNWDLLSAGKIDADLRAQIPEVDQAVTKDEANQILLTQLHAGDDLFFDGQNWSFRSTRNYTAKDLARMLQDPARSAVAASLLADNFPLWSNVLPTLCDAVPRQQDEENRDAILTSIRKLDPTFALAPEDATSIVMSLTNPPTGLTNPEALNKLVTENHLLDMAWSTRSGFQSYATNLAVENPAMYDTFVTTVLQKAPYWKNLAAPETFAR